MRAAVTFFKVVLKALFSQAALLELADERMIEWHGWDRSVAHDFAACLREVHEEWGK